MSFLFEVEEEDGTIYYVSAVNLDTAIDLYRGLPEKASASLNRVEKIASEVAGSVYEEV